MTFAPAFPHDPIRPLGEEIFMVRGSLRIYPGVTVSRNMAVLRHRGALTLVNPVRLGPEGRATLEELGPVTRLLRLGAWHGLDDAWYAETYGPEIWGVASRRYPDPPVDVPVTEETDLGIPGLEVFAFRSPEPELAVRVPGPSPLLLTCDALQHYGDLRYVSPVARAAFPLLGFTGETVVGPLWRRAMRRAGCHDLEGEFRRLLAWRPFERLLGAHGSLLEAGAREAVRRAVDACFGPPEAAASRVGPTGSG